MGKFGIGALVRHPGGASGKVIDKRKGERLVKFYALAEPSWHPKSELEVVANDNAVSARPPVFEKEYSVGDRVRFIRDNPNGGAVFGKVGQEAVVSRVYEHVTSEYGQQVELEDFGCGFPPDAPVSALELVVAPATPPTIAWAKGDRALSMNGDYVTVDTDPDSDNHVWVSIGTTKWRTPVDMLAKWEPKVGDRVRFKDAHTDGTGTVVGDPGYERSSYDWAVRGDGDPKSFFYPDGRFPFRTRLFVTASLEPLPVAAEAQPAALVIEAGKFYRTRDGRKVGPIRRMPTSGTRQTQVWEADQELLPNTLSNWDEHGVCFPKASQQKWIDCDLVAEWVEPVEPLAVAEATATVPESKFGFAVGDHIRPKTDADASFVNDHYSRLFAKSHGESDGTYFVRGFTGSEVGISAKNECDAACYFFPKRFEPAAPPAKFKVGDRVRVDADDPDVATVASRNSEGLMSLKWDFLPPAGVEWWTDGELLLVSSAPAIGSTVTFIATGRLSAINDNGHYQVVFKDLAPAQNSFALPAKFVTAAN